jgi:hypothetical protein
VPFMVLPFESVFPAGLPAPVEPAAPELAAPPPELPLPLCASAMVLESTSDVTKAIVDGFMGATFICFVQYKTPNEIMFLPKPNICRPPFSAVEPQRRRRASLYWLEELLDECDGFALR